MFVTDHKNCTGCGACIDACPQLAVIKIRDKYKFVYPSVQDDLCSFCGRCLEVCPKDKPIERLNHGEIKFEQKYYIAKSKNKEILMNSHAGGIFSLLAIKILSNGGVVYGCIFDENRHPRHVRADNAEVLKKMVGFKPVQSDTEGVYLSVKSDIDNGITVLFSGTPCQCDGLRGYLGRDYSNLILTDMLCGGVTSEGVFNRYHHWLECKLGGKIMNIRFENKLAFGRQRGIGVLYRRGKQRFWLSYPLELDMLNAMILSGSINRRSCGSCKYASKQRVGDISLGRFVNVRHAHPEFPYDNGASLVVISSAKGANIFEQIKDEIYVEESDFQRASANHLLTSSTEQSPYRKNLLTKIYRFGFAKAAAEFKTARFFNAVKIFFRAVIPDKAVILLDRFVRKIKQSTAKLLAKYIK